MKWKQHIDIDLPESTDAFAASDKLKKVQGVIAANVVTCQSLSVKYDSRKVNQQQLLAVLHTTRGKRAA